MDLVLIVVSLPVTLPVMLVTALLVRVLLGTPMFFMQVRPGLHGRPFTMYKFRSMLDTRDAAGNLLPDAVRLSRFGRMLRASSLDELPELLNVVKGEMSLVGPRPLLMQYLPRYTPEQARRHEVPPGITGWAQVNGRNSVPWPERFKLDVWYVDHRSLWLDVKILGLSIKHVLSRRGITALGEATMSEFDPTRNNPVKGHPPNCKPSRS